jgi:hypothetical protein
MSTRIKVVEDGRVVGRCDSRCHDAKSKRCHCVCGGRLHGKGEDVLAIEVLPGMLVDDLAEFESRNGYPAGSLELDVASEIQLRLFDMEVTA